MKTRKTLWPLQLCCTLFLFLLFIAQGIYAPSASAAADFFKALGATQFEERVEISDFSLPSVGGDEVKLSDFEGKVILLNFWATSCAYCRMERPALQTMYDKYKDKEFVVISVSVDRTSIDTVKKYVEEHEITFLNLHDQKFEVASEYGVRGVPVTLFIDKKGKVVGGVLGPRPWDSEEANGLIEQLLSEED